MPPCNLEQIIYRESCKEYEQVAVPEAREDVVESAFVRLGLVFVFFLDADDVFAQVKYGYGDAYETCENEQNVNHDGHKITFLGQNGFYIVRGG